MRTEEGYQTKTFRRFAAAAVSAATFSLAMISASFAAPADPSGPESSALSSCAPTNPLSATPFTCNIYETNANGAPSEDTGPIILPGLVGSGFVVLLESGTDTSVANWSDIVEFAGNADTSTVELFSDPETGFDPALVTTVLNSGPFFITEDPSGVTPYFSGGTQGTDNDYFIHSNADINVPEPLTLSLFGAGLAGTAALRRRKRRFA